MWFLITTLELFKAKARSSSSDSAEPVGAVVGSGRPEGSLACVARWARSALRVERVCVRVDFLVCSAVRRGFDGGLGSDFVDVVVVVVVAAVCSEVSVEFDLIEDDGCGAGGEFDGFVLGDSGGWEDILL
jgi:hypothetical protein